MLREVNPIYREICPYCSGDASAEEIEELGSCRECSVRNRVSRGLTLYDLLEREESEFIEFFGKATGYEPWGLQKNWIKRLVSGENVVMIAPTGMGKTTLLLTYCLYQAVTYGKKTIYVAPTRSLIQQIYGKLRMLNEKTGSRAKILMYHSQIPFKTKREINEKIAKQDYDILLLTSNYVLRKLSLDSVDKTDLIIIDDVDSMLKTSKSVEKTLSLIGYDEETVKLVKEKMKLTWRSMLAREAENRDEYLETAKRLLETEKKISSRLSGRKYRQVAIATATGRVRGELGYILRELLRIDVANISLYGRDVTDSYTYIENLENVIGKIAELGSGGLILVSSKHPFREELDKAMKRVKEKLVEKELVVREAEPKSIADLLIGKVDVVIGSANYYGICVRGIDSPKHVKYIVFLGTPVHSIRASNYLASIRNITRTLLFLKDKNHRELNEAVNEIRKITYRLTPGETKLINSMLKGRVEQGAILSGKIRETYEKIKAYYLKTLEILEKTVREEKIVEIGTTTFIERNGEIIALIPDVYTYIQATGRTSRLMNRCFTHGLSIIIEYRDLGNLVRSLERRLYAMSRDKAIVDLDNLDVEREKKLIEETRRNTWSRELKYRSILVIVESPTKAKTIAGFFGKPFRRRIGNVNVYEAVYHREGELIHLNLVATHGHVFDLTTSPEATGYGVAVDNGAVKPVYETIKKCRVCGHQFTVKPPCPRCGSVFVKDSIEVINVLRKISSEVNEVYIATDPDIEGEKIAYDIRLAIKGFNNNIYRAKLHEITVNEFLKTIDSREKIDENLVSAEIYRRILDRLIGFSLSGKLQTEFNDKNMGAGRVQTPVLKWIVDRYREYSSSKVIVSIYKLSKYPQIRYKHVTPIEDKSIELRESIEALFKLRNREIIVVKPKPPYTTDQLLLDASRNGYNVSKTMRIAQELFESGLITYHRTSNTYVSNTAITLAEKYLENKGLKELFKPNHWGEKEAHEAIRPTHPLDAENLEKAVNEGLINVSIPLTKHHYRIYELIFNRFIASQMKPYVIARQEYEIYVNDKPLGRITIDTGIVENGFNIIEKPIVIGELDKVEEFKDTLTLSYRVKTGLKPLYRDGEIVQKMKNEGIGRPSTYGKIVESIVRHGYVVRSKRINYLIPTSKGLKTLDYLERNYSELVSVDMTRRMEASIDKLVKGNESLYKLVVETIGLLEKHSLSITSFSTKQYEATLNAT